MPVALSVMTMYLKVLKSLPLYACKLCVLCYCEDCKLKCE